MQRKATRITRQQRIRAKIAGTPSRPRLSLFRSNRHLWLQLIDDTKGSTLVSSSDLELVSKNNKPTKKNKVVKSKKSPPPLAKYKTSSELAAKTGELLAKKALKKGIHMVVFDRGGYKYQGLVKAVADGARTGGLKF